MAKLKSAKDKLLKKDSSAKKEAYKRERDKETDAILENKKTTKKQKVDARNEIRFQKRFDILERDNYTCQYCGKSREKYPDIELEVDHKIPLSKGGSNEDNNLVTSCYACNEGKKDRLLNETKDKMWCDNLDVEAVSAVEKIGTKDAIKKYMLSDEAETSRKLLYRHYAEEKEECPNNCESCSTISGQYLECFELLVDIKNEIEGIEPVTNERKKINVLDEKQETLKCNSCYLADRCQHYLMGSTCVYDFTNSTDFSNTEEAYKTLLKAQSERVLRGIHFEKVDGGVADKNVTTEIQIMMDMLKQYDEKSTKGFDLKIGISGKSNMGNDEGSKMLAQIFSGLIPQKEQPKQIEGEQSKQLPEKTESTHYEIVSGDEEVDDIFSKEDEREKVRVNNKS